jgi:hypothetical protein
MKYVLIYTSADDVAEKALVYFAAPRARWAEFQANGTLLPIGPYAGQSGALAVFTTREAAEGSRATTRSCCAAWSASGRSGSGRRRLAAPEPGPAAGVPLRPGRRPPVRRSRRRSRR